MTAALHWLAVLVTCAFTLAMAVRVVFHPRLRVALDAFVRMLLGTAFLCLLGKSPLAAFAVFVLAGLVFAAIRLGTRRWGSLVEESAPAENLVYEPWLAAAALGFLLLATLGIAREGFRGERTSPIRTIVERLEAEPTAEGQLPAHVSAPEPVAAPPALGLLAGLAGLLVLATLVTSYAVWSNPIPPPATDPHLAAASAPAEGPHVE